MSTLSSVTEPVHANLANALNMFEDGFRLFLKALEHYLKVWFVSIRKDKAF